MKHNIRQRVINQFGLPVVKVETVTGELGSRISDKHGIEIFEGDKVKSPYGTAPVKFEQGNFYVDGYHPLGMFGSKDLEVVGHAEV